MNNDNIEKMKKIEDYLHLYVGCDMYSVPQNSEYFIEKLTGVDTDCMRVEDVAVPFPVSKHEYKLLLRPLADMTEEEAKSIFDEAEQELIKKDFARWKRLHLRSLIYSADDFKNLLSKDFDLFGLIEAGLAIDKTTLTPNK